MVEHQDSLWNRGEKKLGKRFKHLLGGAVAYAKICLSCTLSCARKVAWHVQNDYFWARSCMLGNYFLFNKTRYFHGWTGSSMWWMEAHARISLSFMLLSSATVRIRIWPTLQVKISLLCWVLSEGFKTEETLSSNHCFLKCLLLRAMTKHLPKK